jgi:hypothetical protein
MCVWSRLVSGLDRTLRCSAVQMVSYWSECRIEGCRGRVSQVVEHPQGDDSEDGVFDPSNCAARLLEGHSDGRMKCHEVGLVGLEAEKEKKKRARRIGFVVSCGGSDSEVGLAVRLLKMSVGASENRNSAATGAKRQLGLEQEVHRQRRGSAAGGQTGFVTRE